MHYYIKQYLSEFAVIHFISIIVFSFNISISPIIFASFIFTLNLTFPVISGFIIFLKSISSEFILYSYFSFFKCSYEINSGFI